MRKMQNDRAKGRGKVDADAGRGKGRGITGKDRGRDSEEVDGSGRGGETLEEDAEEAEEKDTGER